MPVSRTVGPPSCIEEASDLHVQSHEQTCTLSRTSSSMTIEPSARAQFFDAAFRKQYPHASRYLATMYAQPAWLAAATAPSEPPAKAFTFADAAAGRTFEKAGGRHAAAHVERYRPAAWSGASSGWFGLRSRADFSF